MTKRIQPILYQPRGRAAEYVDNGLAANIFLGCNHGCKYCYVPAQRRMSAEKFHKEIVPKQRVIQRIEEDLRIHGTMKKPVFLCFMCDPYPAMPDLWHVTREAIRSILRSKNAVNILTKGGIRAARDFEMLLADKRNLVGATLTFKDPVLSKEWEPLAALPDNRLEMLSLAKDMGIRTWASIEPVIDPEQSLAIMKAALPYVDLFKIGKVNHDPQREMRINWKEFLGQAEEMMKSAGKTTTINNDTGAGYTIKNDLLAAAGRKG